MTISIDPHRSYGELLAAHVAAIRNLLKGISSFFREHPAVLFSLAYVYFAILGLIYKWSLFRRFDIDILDYAEINDFLLAAFNVPQTILLAIAAPLLVAALYVGAVAVNAATVSALQALNRLTGARLFLSLAAYFSRPRPHLGLLLLLGFAALWAWGAPTISASMAASRFFQGRANRVEVQLRIEAPASSEVIVSRVRQLIGTTERFVFLYDVAADDSEIVPIDNVLMLKPLD